MTTTIQTHYDDIRAGALALAAADQPDLAVARGGGGGGGGGGGHGGAVGGGAIMAVAGAVDHGGGGRERRPFGGDSNVHVRELGGRTASGNWRR